MCSSSIDVSYFEKFDIQHMHGKFPHASGYLIERLGQANTAQRQLLRYYERRHLKFVNMRNWHLPELIAPKKSRLTVRESLS